jgi:hypothetical protein
VIGFFPLRHKGLTLFYALAAVFSLKEFPNETSFLSDARFQVRLWFRPDARPQPLIFVFVTVRMRS